MPRILAGALALLLTSGPALAWGVQGSIEPDHPLDNHQTTTDTDRNEATHAIYFNAVLTLPATGTNPNLPYLAGHVHANAIESAVAYFGYWKDCNNDGYIGSAATGTTTYPSVALHDRSICPPSAGWGSPYPHNDADLVRELIPIGWEANRAPIEGGPPSDILDDAGARVWGDRGLPDAPTIDCELRPRAGTFASVGRMLQHADCRARYYAPAIVPQPAPCSQEPTNLRPNAFYDDANCQDGPGLLEPSTRPGYYMWDCSKHSVGSYPMPLPYVPPSTGSLYAGTSYALAPLLDGKCNEPSPTADETYRLLLAEDRGDGRKRSTTFTFEFVDERGAHPTPTSRAEITDARLTLAAAPANQEIGPIWVGTRTSLERLPFLRSDLGPSDAEHFTFYAGTYLTPQKDSDPGRHLKDYLCSSSCDTYTWWNPAYTDARMPTASRSGIEYGVFPGEKYRFIDVDCYDGEVARKTGVRASLNDLNTGGTCTTRSTPGDGGLLH